MSKIKKLYTNSAVLEKSHLLTLEEAQEIYNAGSETVVKVLLYLFAEINKLQKKVDTLETTIANFSKNSSNSSKPPSSDDITKPQKKTKKTKKKVKLEDNLDTQNINVHYSPKKK